MQAISNNKLIKNRSTWSGRLMLVGFLLILGSAGLTFMSGQTMEYILPAYVALFGGFIIFNIGASAAVKWRREPRPDQAVARALKGLDNRHRLYNYLLPADHVLLAPWGLVVFQVRRLAGDISCDGSTWRHKRSWLSRLRFAAEEQLGNPTKDVQNDIAQVETFLDKHLQSDAEVPIEGIILFPHIGANLTLNQPTVPVMTSKEAKEYLRQAATKRPKLDADTYNELADLFDDIEGAEEAEALPDDEKPRKTSTKQTQSRRKAK